MYNYLYINYIYYYLTHKIAYNYIYVYKYITTLVTFYFKNKKIVSNEEVFFD